jgi:hypothetical protein
MSETIVTIDLGTVNTGSIFTQVEQRYFSYAGFESVQIGLSFNFSWHSRACFV